MNRSAPLVLDPEQSEIDCANGRVYNPKMVATRAGRLLFYTFAVIITLQASLPGRLRAQPQLHTWFHYHGEKSLQKLEPYKDVLTSVSLFGSPDRKFVTQCREFGLQVYSLVSGPVENIVTTDKAEATIDAYLKKCRDLGLDGIDLDYENLPAKTRGAYGAFIRKLSARLRGAGKKLSICVAYTPGMSRAVPDSGFYDPGIIGRHCDLVRVMCYDKHLASQPGHGPTSTAPWARSAMKYWLKHIPGRKLVMGMPAYSNDYDIRPGGRGRQVDRASPDTTAPLKPHWRPFEKINVYRYADKVGNPRVFYASDSKSTQAHLETVRQLGLGGFGFWHHLAVAPATWKVIRKTMTGK